VADKFNYINFSIKEIGNLFQSAKGGDVQAFQKLSGIIREIAYSYFFSKYSLGKLYSKDDADDLANNVFLAFAEQYQNVDNIENWLRRVLFLSFINWYKRSKAQRTFEFDETIFREVKELNAGNSVDAEKVVDTLNTLSEDKQNIVKMRFWKDLKFSEIAQILNKSEDAVKKMFYRTIDELKQKL